MIGQGGSEMAIVGLLSAHHGADGAEPWGLLAVGGIAIVERQMRQAICAGATRVIVKVESDSPGLLAMMERAGPRLIIARDGAALSDAIGGDDALLFAEGLIIDDRIVARMAAMDGAALAVWSDGAPPEAERIDQATCWAGLALIPAHVATGVAATLGDWDMQSTLLRATAALASSRLEIGTVNLYVADLGRDVPLLWSAVRTPDTAAAALEALLGATDVTGGGWVSRFMHPPVANFLTRWLVPTPIRPVTVRILASCAGVIAGLALATGWLSAGVALALGTGFLSRVADKLERVRVVVPRWREPWDVADRTVEYAWYICLGSWLARAPGGSSAWLLAAITIMFAASSELQRRFFSRFVGRSLDSAGRFERRFSLVAAGRDTLIWALVPFGWFGQWLPGLAVLAAYASTTFFVVQTRLFIRLGEVSPVDRGRPGPR